MEPFIERDCIITAPNGEKFELGGAVITERMVIAYLGMEEPPAPILLRSGRLFWRTGTVGTDAWRGKLTDWSGNDLGTYTIQSTWRQRGTRMYAICGTIDGRDYHGRTQGPGMIVMLRSYQ